MQKKETVYLAGKITGDPYYFTKFYNAQKKLEEGGFIVVNPALLPAEGFTWEAYMRMSGAMKYRKKPVVIGAMQWDGKDLLELSGFVGDAMIIGPGAVMIRTLEGDLRVSRGDYIIKGVQGEFYPCKPDIFEKTYEVCEGE